MLLVPLLPLALSTAGYAQTLDKAKLDQFFDRLAEKMQSRVVIEAVVCLETGRSAAILERKNNRPSVLALAL